MPPHGCYFKSITSLPFFLAIGESNVISYQNNKVKLTGMYLFSCVPSMLVSFGSSSEAASETLAIRSSNAFIFEII